MDDRILVTCHAPLYSLLQFETSRSKRDQKGFLLGRVINEVISTTTDENEVHNEEKTSIYIEHCLPITNKNLFSSTGKVKTDLLKSLSYKNKIIGWYSFRRNSILKPSLIEKRIHTELIQVLEHMNSELFLFGILTSSASQSLATHTFNQVFLRLHSETNLLISTKVKIHTLSDFDVYSCNYITDSKLPTSSKLEEIIKSVTDSEENDVQKVLKIQLESQVYLTKISKELYQEELERCKLLKEIEKLKIQLGLSQNNEGLADRLIENSSDEGSEEFIQYNGKENYSLDSARNPLDLVGKHETFPYLEIEEEPAAPAVTTTPQQQEAKVTKVSYSTALSTPSASQSPTNIKTKTNCDGQLEQNHFVCKTPVMRPGLGPPSRKSRNSRLDRIASPDMFSVVDIDDSDDGSNSTNLQA